MVKAARNGVFCRHNTVTPAQAGVTCIMRVRNAFATCLVRVRRAYCNYTVATSLCNLTPPPSSVMVCSSSLTSA